MAKRKGARAVSDGLLTRDELAAGLGTHAHTIFKWQRDGLPVAKPGRSGVPARYDLAACLAWKAARDVAAAKNGGMSLAEERAKLARAQTQRAELDLERQRATMLEAGDVERTWATFVASCRARLLALPRAAADRVAQAAGAGPAAVEALLRELVHEALRELAGARAAA